MRTTWKAAAGLAVALATIGSTCEDSDNRVTGTYTLAIQESRDTCDTELGVFGSQVTITAGPDGGYILDFGTQGQLAGDFNDAGLLIAQGTTSVPVPGHPEPVEAEMQIQLQIRQGQITDGSGRLTYEGTFPDVPTTCVQEFFVTGHRAGNRAPVVG